MLGIIYSYKMWQVSIKHNAGLGLLREYNNYIDSSSFCSLFLSHDYCSEGL